LSPDGDGGQADEQRQADDGKQRRIAAEDEVQRGSSLGHGLISGKSFASFRTSIKL
jgi:hypothetical protein